MRKMKCSSGTALNTVLSGEREGGMSVNNEATPLADTWLRQMRCSYTTCPPCSLPAKTRTSSRQFLFLLFFSLGYKQPFLYLFHGSRKNRGCHVHAEHQISANINLCPGIWIVSLVWHFKSDLKAEATTPKCLCRVSKIHHHHPVVLLIIFQCVILFKMLLQFIMLINMHKDHGKPFFKTSKLVTFPYFPPNPCC